MAWYDDPIMVITVALVVIIASGTVIYAMRKYGKKPFIQRKIKPIGPDPSVQLTGLPFKISKSVQTSLASNAKDELRILDLEREILSDAIRRLYEAHAEGKISEQEREKLAVTYKNRMNSIKESISKDESIVALHELEGMQEDLMKLFSERFGELTSKVEELRSRIDVKPIREIPVKLSNQTSKPTQIEEEEEEEAVEEKPKKKRRTASEKTDAKTEAERRIDSIRSEVEKVLDKLGQMEIES
jgi:hypothetical protein